MAICCQNEFLFVLVFEYLLNAWKTKSCSIICIFSLGLWHESVDVGVSCGLNVLF